MTIIDRNNWPRESLSLFFAPMPSPVFVFPVDVTALREYTKGKHLSFHAAL